MVFEPEHTVTSGLFVSTLGLSVLNTENGVMDTSLATLGATTSSSPLLTFSNANTMKIGEIEFTTQVNDPYADVTIGNMHFLSFAGTLSIPTPSANDKLSKLPGNHVPVISPSSSQVNMVIRSS